MPQSPPGPIEPGLQRLAIAAAMAMVRKEASALLALRAVLRRHSEASDAALRRLRTEDPSWAAAEGSVILRSTSANAEADLAAVVLAARTSARLESLAQLQRQLLSAGKALQRAGVSASHSELSAPARGPNATDSAAAEAAAKSLASGWLQQSVAGLLDWTRAGAHGAVPQIGDQATRSVDFRLRRTAATETSVAYNDEANEILQHVGGAIADAPAGKLLWKRWEAVLDRGLCGKCANYDNQVVRCNESFRGGEIPGTVHPNCRCVEVLALFQTDLNIAHAVAREMFGPGLGRAAEGRRDVFEDAHQWTPEERAEWMRRYARAKEDPAFRAKLLRYEVRRHEDSAAAGRELPSAIVPRLRPSNVMARDRRSTRQVHDDTAGAFLRPSADRVKGVRDWRARRDREVPMGSYVAEKELQALAKTRLDQIAKGSIRRDAAYAASRHAATGMAAQRDIRRGEEAHVFKSDLDLKRIEKVVWQRGEYLGEIRGWHRFSFRFNVMLGSRIQAGKDSAPLHIAEVKAIFRNGTWEYHLDPRRTRARRQT